MFADEKSRLVLSLVFKQCLVWEKGEKGAKEEIPDSLVAEEERKEGKSGSCGCCVRAASDADSRGIMDEGE